MHVECVHCGNEWDYGGKNDHNATCPDCLRKTPVDADALAGDDTQAGE